jgi:hypothetical protein
MTKSASPSRKLDPQVVASDGSGVRAGTLRTHPSESFRVPEYAHALAATGRLSDIVDPTVAET